MIATKVTLDGNFFRYDPGDTLYKNIGAMLLALAAELEQIIQAQVRNAPMPYSTGWTADHVIGYTTSPRTGKHWATWAAVGMNTTGMDKAQAIRTMAAASSVEQRFHPFRNAKSAVYRSRALITVNLTKGLE